MRQGEEGDSLFVVKEGTFEMSITGESGVRPAVGQLSPGIFGEMSLITWALCSAVVAPSVVRNHTLWPRTYHDDTPVEGGSIE